jgi:hypothetical protein
MRNAYTILVGKPGGKSPIGRPKRRWENNIIMNLTQIVCVVDEWIHLDQDQWWAIVNMKMNLRIL